MQLTLRNILEVFHVPEKVVHEWIEKHHMPCTMANEQYHFNYIAVLDWALEHQIKLTPEVLSLGEKHHQNQGLIYEAVKKGGIYYDIPGQEREEAIKNIVDILPLPEKSNREALSAMLIVRERLTSTAVGEGVALPHVRNPVVLPIDEALITLSFLKNPVDFKAFDNKPVRVVFTLLTPSVKVHMAVLSRLAFFLQNPRLQEHLQSKASSEKILAQIRVLESTTV
ncbi:MAG: PTS sugar transporter subunit IIA [Candidatus Omnitrophica bacterium]|nr:PTS sugar transporter subunit IIA [Candidatus Omnitrophota bacterium]